MPIWKAALLGVIQGVTSVLPVSSSGHIALFGRLLGEQSAGSLSFMVYLHIGTLAAVLWTFQRDVIRLISAYLQIFADLIKNGVSFFANVPRGKPVTWRKLGRNNYRRLALLILAAAAVEGVVSLCMRNLSFLGASNLLITAMGFFVTALLLFISSYSAAVKNTPVRTHYTDAVLAGALQGAAGVPGVSRLGMTMSAGALAGMEETYLVRFSFLMSIPGIIGAMIFILPSEQAMAEVPVGAGACVVGVVVAGIVTALMIRLVRNILTRKASRFFALYTIVAGIISIAMYFR